MKLHSFKYLTDWIHSYQREQFLAPNYVNNTYILVKFTHLQTSQFDWMEGPSCVTWYKVQTFAQTFPLAVVLSFPGF
jgi:hypothetical protein